MLANFSPHIAPKFAVFSPLHFRTLIQTHCGVPIQPMLLPWELPTLPIIPAYDMALEIHVCAMWAKADGAEDTWPQGTINWLQDWFTNFSKKTEQSHRDCNPMVVCTWTEWSWWVHGCNTSLGKTDKQTKKAIWRENQWNEQFPETIRVTTWPQSGRERKGSSSHWRLLTLQLQPPWASFLWEVPLINPFLTCPCLSEFLSLVT